MTRAQAKLLAEFGPFELKGDVILDVNGVGRQARKKDRRIDRKETGKVT